MSRVRRRPAGGALTLAELVDVGVMPIRRKTMRNERRRNIRIPGPFTASLGDGPHDTVRIMDLSEGGCFIHAPGEAPALGRQLVLTLTLSRSTFKLTGEILYVRPGEGYAVLFAGLSEKTYAGLERAIAQLRQSGR
jgi:hypothetical protein